MLAFLQMTTPPLTVLAFDWPDATHQTSESCQKDTKKLIKNFVGWPRFDTLDYNLFSEPRECLHRRLAILRSH